MTDAATPNPILALIDRAVEEKTFSLDALTAVQKIKEQATKLDTDLKYARDSLKSQQHETEREASAKRRAEEVVKTWEAREAAIAVREAKVTELEKASAVAQAEARTFNSVFDRMFANRQFREMIIESGNVPMAGGAGGYPQSMPNNKAVTVDRSDIK